MSRGRRSSSPLPPRDADMDIDSHSPKDKSNAKVVIVTNLTRNVVEGHLRTVFGYYGPISKIDLPVYGKSGQNRGKAALEFADAASANKAYTHMNGGQLDGAVLKVELSDLPIRSNARSPVRPARGPRNGRDRPRSFSRSRSRTPRSRSRSPLPPPRRRGPDTFRDSYRGRPYGRRGGGPGRDFRRSRSRTRSRSPPRRPAERAPLPRRRSPSYTRGGYNRRRSRSSVRSSRSRSSYSRSRTRSMSYSSRSRYSRSRSGSRSRSVSRGRRSVSGRRSRSPDIRDSRSRSPRP